MKTLIALFLMTSAAFAQTVTISIKVGDRAVEATVSADAVAALKTFIAEQKNEDGTPKYTSISELLIQHFRDSLATPLVRKYSPAIKAASEAKAAAETAAETAAAGTVVVK